MISDPHVQRQRRKNLAVLAILIITIALIYGISIVKQMPHA
ncbi:MAG: hypothetical protein ACK5O9_04520 [Holosporales bacterium]|jgi:hypothetical protein